MIMMIYSFILIDCIMNPCDWIRVQDINFFLVLNFFFFFFFNFIDVTNVPLF